MTGDATGLLLPMRLVQKEPGRSLRACRIFCTSVIEIRLLGIMPASIKLNTICEAIIVLAATCFSSVALADPCEAPIPKFGAQFDGTVRYVGDGDSLCVGTSTDARTWIEVRLADFYAPELQAPGGGAAKSTLERIAMGKAVQCTAGKRSYDRVVATCTLGGLSVADLMRRAGIAEGGRGQ